VVKKTKKTFTEKKGTGRGTNPGHPGTVGAAADKGTGITRDKRRVWEAKYLSEARVREAREGVLPMGGEIIS